MSGANIETLAALRENIEGALHLLQAALPRAQVILAVRHDEDADRIDHIECKDVQVIPNEDFLQMQIYLSAALNNLDAVAGTPGQRRGSA